MHILTTRTRSKSTPLLIVATVIALFSLLPAQAGAYVRNVSKIGGLGPGTGAGSLRGPGGVAVSPDGEDVYVADTENDRISEYTAAGSFERAWGWGVRNGDNELQTCTGETGCRPGSTGRGTGQLNEPVGVAVGGDGTVYVLNRAQYDGRVQAFDPSGAGVTYAGTVAPGYGAGESNFTYPLPISNDIAVAGNGRIYVADNTEAGARIVSFDPKGGPSKSIPVTAVGQINTFALAPSGKIWVAEAFSTAALLEPDGTTVEQFYVEQGSAAMAVLPGSENVLIEPSQSPNEKEETKLYEYEEDGTRSGAISVTQMTPAGPPYPYGLAIDPTYQYVEEGAPVESEPGTFFVTDRAGGGVDILATAKPLEPKLEETTFAAVGSTGATLSAKVNPRGVDTHVYFEYGTTADYGSISPASPGQDLGAGFESVQAFTRLSGLQPGTTYYFRAVAVNAKGTQSETPFGSATNFATFPIGGSFGLPDGRAYELATPGSELQNVEGVFATAGGNGLAYLSTLALPGSQSGALETAYVGSRGSSGWSGVPITPPTAGGASKSTSFIAPDMSVSISETNRALDPGAPAGGNLYLRDSATGAETLITRQASSVPVIEAVTYGTSSDGHHVFFTSDSALTPDSPVGFTEKLYEYSKGSLKNVGILPGETTPTTIRYLPTRVAGDPVSEDGSHVFFLAEPSPGAAFQLFARIDDARTVEVSASQRTISDPEAAQQASTFVGATPDGSIAYFLSSARLTDDAYTGSEGGEPRDRAQNLYRYDLATGTLTDLTIAEGPPDEELGAAVTGAAIAADGDSAYFVARGALAPGATVGVPNLFHWTAGGGIRFISTLESFDTMEKMAETSRQTADGSVFFFTSASELDPAFSNRSGSNQIYRYAAASGQVVCVSCTRTTASQGEAGFKMPSSISGGRGGSVLAADGNRLFFQTQSALVPQDTNGVADVYEWEGGVVRLISSGTATLGSTLVDATASGSDVFFDTADQLVPADHDHYADVYDARVGGGFSEPTAPSPCDGEACLSAAGAPPPSGDIGSRSFNGPGNKKAKRHRKHKKRHRKHARQRKHKRSHGHPAVGKRG